MSPNTIEELLTREILSSILSDDLLFADFHKEAKKCSCYTAFYGYVEKKIYSLLFSESLSQLQRKIITISWLEVNVWKIADYFYSDDLLGPDPDRIRTDSN